MIPKAYIDAWASTEAPWQEDTQVEQDLIISRILVDLFQNEFLRKHLAFRGGTALHKLFFSSQVRYSEDIDLVQIIEGPIKPILNEIAEQLSFLGSKDDRNVEPSSHSWTAYYSYDTENPPPPTMNIKIEINTREHTNVLDLYEGEYNVDNAWYSGSAKIKTYQVDELLGTKLRALYQRKKGRDLFDLYYALTHLDLDKEKIIRSFKEYMEQNDNKPPTCREFELNMEKKMSDTDFTNDTGALLRRDIIYNPKDAYKYVFEELIQMI